MSTIELREQKLQVFEFAVQAMADFKAAFGRTLSAGLIAELHAAELLQLKTVGINQPGYDALGPYNERYQIKYRAATTLNVDVNNFGFDYLVLVNLDSDYRLQGMWRISKAQAETVFEERPAFRKYQATQNTIKRIGEVVFPKTTPVKSGVQAVTNSGRAWRDLRGMAPSPLMGEDAQQWVTRSRQEESDLRHST